MAKLEGEITREQKNAILNIFCNEFKLDSNKAKDLFASTSYLLQSENNFIKNTSKVLSSSKNKFSPEQAESTITLISKIANIDGEISFDQQALLDTVKHSFKSTLSDQQKWED